MSIFLPSSIPLRLPFAHYRNFNFAKPIKISNPSSELTNYQIKVELNENNFPFSKCRGDGSDLRFLSDNRNTLDFWIESWSSAAAGIWIKVDEIPSYSEKIIWLLYGNPSASPASNGTNTFEFFDDFPGSSLDTDKWDSVNNGGSISVADSIVSIQSTGLDKDNAEIISKLGFEFGNMMETYARVTQVVDDYHMLGRASNFTTGTYGQESPTENYIYQYVCTSDNPDTQQFYSKKEDSGTYVNTTIPLNSWNMIGMFSKGTNAEYWRDGNLVENITDSSYCPAPDVTASIFMLAFSYGTNAKIEADWVRVRKYTSPEPKVIIL